MSLIVVTNNVKFINAKYIVDKIPIWKNKNIPVQKHGL